jgi:predicted nucleic acid-binding protein
MKIFIDTNIILDFLLKREGKYDIYDVYILFKKLETWEIKWITSDICISTAIYFFTKI